MSDLTATLSNINQNVPYSPGVEACMLNGDTDLPSSGDKNV